MRTFGKFTAVNDISFRVKQARYLAFLGPNGSGKTTVIKMLTGCCRLPVELRRSKDSMFGRMRKKCVNGSGTCRRSSASMTISP